MSDERNLANALAVKRLAIAHLRLDIFNDHRKANPQGYHAAEAEYRTAIAVCLRAGREQIMSEPDAVIAEDIACPT